MTALVLNDAVEISAQLEAIHPECYAWALTCCGQNSAEAEEVLQMSYVKILNGQARYAGRSAFKTWLFGVIRMTAREQRRKTWFRWLRFGSLQEAEEASTRDATPDEAMATDERAAQVRAALQRLPVRQREALMLVFYHDLTLDAAAEAMGVSPGTARTHYERGKRRLLEVLPENFSQL